MAHYQQLKFVEELSLAFPQFFNHKKVLEIGSWNTNGSIRTFFKDCDYTGVDIAKGPGVDLVCHGEDVDLPDQSFDITISCECFEHNPEWGKTFNNMERMLKDDGLFVMTCATLGREEHGTSRCGQGASLTSTGDTHNYYHNLKEQDIRENIPLDNFFSEYKFFVNVYSRDLYLVAIKKGQSHRTQISEQLVKNVAEIRKPKYMSVFARARYHFFFFTRAWVATLLGEKKYHDLRYKFLGQD